MQTINQCLTEFFIFCCGINIHYTRNCFWLGDLRIITRQSVVDKSNKICTKLLSSVRLPNNESKTAQYSGTNPPYPHHEAAQYFADSGVLHLLIDLRALTANRTEGKLSCKKRFGSFGFHPQRQYNYRNYLCRSGGWRRALPPEFYRSPASKWCQSFKACFMPSLSEVLLNFGAQPHMRSWREEGIHAAGSRWFSIITDWDEAGTDWRKLPIHSDAREEYKWSSEVYWERLYHFLWAHAPPQRDYCRLPERQARTELINMVWQSNNLKGYVTEMGNCRA